MDAELDILYTSCKAVEILEFKAIAVNHISPFHQKKNRKAVSCSFSAQNTTNLPYFFQI